MQLQIYSELSMQSGCSPRITCASRYEIRSNHHIGFDHCPPLGVGLGHYRGVGHGGVLDQTVLYLTRADAVARSLEHIIRAALVPQVAIGIAHRQVAGAAPVGCELGVGCRLVFPVAQKENGVRLAVYVVAVQRHVAGLAHRAFAPSLVNHLDHVAWVSHAHAAGFRRPQRVAIADDVVDFCLAEHFVRLHAHLLLAVAKHRIAHSLARAHDGAQFELELLAHGRVGGAGVGLHHGLEGGGEQKGVGYPAAAHEFQGSLRAEAPTERDDGAAKVQRRQQRIHQSTGPGPVCGAPEHRVRRCVFFAVKPKPVLAADETAQVADQRTVG